MNAQGSTKILNSLLPATSSAVLSSKNASSNAFFGTSGSNKGFFGSLGANKGFFGSSGANNGFFGLGSSGWPMSLMIFTVLVILMGICFYFFQTEFSDAWKGMTDIINGYFGNPTGPANVYVAPDVSGSTPPDDSEEAHEHENLPASSAVASSTVESVLPGPSGPSGPTEVFNVSSNLYTYYDAEPLCKALGAQLATYDQVKDAWAKGADWCNYGWVQGQMAVYPTSDDTYAKLQKGPAEQQLSCGRPGVNGGYFDNPELRYGVTCYGPKPAKTSHDIVQATLATPTSPDALAFDKKVAEYKSEANSIGILPFNGNKWD